MINRINVKIVLALISVLAIIMVLSTFLIVNQRSEVLREEMLVKASALAKIGAKGIEGVLEQALASGQFSEEQLFDTDYQEITEGSLAGSAIPKYSTAYDAYLDETIRDFEDTFLSSDDVVFAVLVDRNGYLPTHNTKYAKALTGDAEKDKVGNRTKRIFNDPVGLAAAQYNNEDGKGYLQQVYKRDTGVTMWDVSAPVYVNDKHWGGFRIGFSMAKVDAAIADLTQGDRLLYVPGAAVRFDYLFVGGRTFYAAFEGLDSGGRADYRGQSG